MSCKIRDRRSKLLQEQSVESQKSHHHAADKSVDMRLTGCWQKSNLCGWLMWRICIFALNSWFVATISFEFGVSLDCRSCFEEVWVFSIAKVQLLSWLLAGMTRIPDHVHAHANSGSDLPALLSTVIVSVAEWNLLFSASHQNFDMMKRLRFMPLDFDKTALIMLRRVSILWCCQISHKHHN